ncbi:ankyrin repeat-containing protein NPR4-like isoform X2 [Mangifera indica]|nr:ankyrin repeat-containing protein NPR4-like isoform X2 [Mangifera indica]
MKTYFLSQELWDIVNDGIYDPTYTVSQSKQQQKQLKESRQKDKTALFILQQAVDDNIFTKISLAQTAQEAWSELKKEFQSVNPQTTNIAEGRGPEDHKNYLPLYKAILKGDLKSVGEVCEDDKNALEARITVNLDTALHVAVGTGQANHIVEYLLNKMSMDQVSLKNKEGNTVLSIAAIVGNVPAATMIHNKDENAMRSGRDVDKCLLYISNDSRRIPLIEATLHGQKKMIQFLLGISNNYLDYASAPSFHRTSDVLFVKMLISSGFYDLALYLVKKRPALATTTFYGGESLLSEITKKASAFSCGETRKLQFWKFLVPSKVPIGAKEREENLMPDKALELVKHLCKEITKDLDRAPFLLKLPLLRAAELGIYQVVEEIIKLYPDAIWFTNRKNHNIVHLAIINRQEKVFELIFQMSGRKNWLLMSHDVEKNNILHLAGKLAPRFKLNTISSAALQMQREIKWFKEVENNLPPDYQEETNSKGQTPATVFTEEHKELVQEGEKWMKDAATSCSVAAAFIATIVFAAVITIPGDYAENGRPKLYGQKAFKIFVISNALSLSSSISVIILFLSFFTARYREQDFLYVLPNRLMWCLYMLLLSLMSLITAFCACAYLVYYERKTYEVTALVFASALLPLSLLVRTQYPKILDLFISIFAPVFFKKRRTGILY